MRGIADGEWIRNARSVDLAYGDLLEAAKRCKASYETGRIGRSQFTYGRRGYYDNSGVTALVQ